MVPFRRSRAAAPAASRRCSPCRCSRCRSRCCCSADPCRCCPPLPVLLPCCCLRSCSRCRFLLHCFRRYFHRRCCRSAVLPPLAPEEPSPSTCRQPSPASGAAPSAPAPLGVARPRTSARSGAPTGPRSGARRVYPASAVAALRDAPPSGGIGAPSLESRDCVHVRKAASDAGRPPARRRTTATRERAPAGRDSEPHGSVTPHDGEARR